MNGCFSFPSFKWHWHQAISIQLRWGNSPSRGSSRWSLSDDELPETMADPGWTLHRVGNTFRATLFLDFSVLTQNPFTHIPPDLLPASSLGCQQFTTQKVVCVCVRVCGRRSGAVPGGMASGKTPSQHGVCVQLRRFWRSCTSGRPPERKGWLLKGMGTHTSGSFGKHPDWPDWQRGRGHYSKMDSSQSHDLHRIPPNPLCITQGGLTSVPYNPQGSVAQQFRWPSRPHPSTLQGTAGCAPQGDSGTQDPSLSMLCPFRGSQTPSLGLCIRPAGEAWEKNMENPWEVCCG